MSGLWRWARIASIGAIVITRIAIIANAITGRDVGDARHAVFKGQDVVEEARRDSAATIANADAIAADVDPTSIATRDRIESAVAGEGQCRSVRGYSSGVNAGVGNCANGVDAAEDGPIAASQQCCRSSDRATTRTT